MPEPPAHDFERVAALVDEDESPAELERSRARGAAPSEEIQDEAAAGARGGNDAAQDADRLLRGIAELLAARRAHDRVPPGVGGQLPARSLLRGHEPRRHVRDPLDGLAVEVVTPVLTTIKEDVV